MTQLLKLLPCCLVLILFSGCASMQYNDLAPSIKHDFPPLSTETTTYVGDAILIQGRVYAAEFLVIEKDIDKFCYQVPKGQYIKVGSDKNKNYFDLSGSNGNVGRNVFCDPLDGIYVSKKNADEICLITIFNSTICYDTPLRVTKNYVPVPDMTQKSLYFSGLKFNRVHFLYTERVGGITVHSHEVSYDMNESQTIGYKGARIKILNATNESITYELLENFPERDNIIQIEPVEEETSPNDVRYY